MTKLDAGLITLLPASDPGSAAVWGSKRINPGPQFCLCLAWSGYPSNDDDDLGVKLDRSHTFRHHLVALRKKLSWRVTLLRRLVGSGWGAGAKTLRITTLSLVHSTSEYCAPVWCRSAHTCLIDSVLNDALRIVTGCLRPTPTDHLLVLSGIQPVEIRRMGATLSLAYRGSLDPDHILYGLLSGSSDTRQVRLRSRRPFVQLRDIVWTTLPDLASALLNGQITNGKWSTVKMLPGSVLLCPGPVPGLL